MIKFTGIGDNGRKMLGIGLSEGNIQKLKEGKPIHFSAEEVKMAGFDVLIMHGATEQEIVKQLTPWMKGAKITTQEEKQ